MRFLIPAKTFLLGEYAALAEASACLLTTTPCFSLTLTNQQGLKGIHPDSPAGLLWQAANLTQYGLHWEDPYQGCGGLGASSAQFLGTYRALCHLQKSTPSLDDMLDSYYHYAFSGQGLKPSGYDVIAQSQAGCVFINKSTDTIQSYPWPFTDLSFFLVHTGVKLATHQHLQEVSLPLDISQLSALTDQAQEAFKQANSKQLIQLIQAYHEQLVNRQLVATHSLKNIEQLQTLEEVIAIKGCGALGADVLLILSLRCHSQSLATKLSTLHYRILATEKMLCAPGRM